MNALAAAHLVSTGAGDLLIFSGGRTAGPDRPSEARAMYAYMRRFFSEEQIPEEAVILEETSIDTAANAEHVHDILRHHGVEAVVLVTTRSHAPNARRLFINRGIAVRALSVSEDVVGRRSHGHAGFTRRYKRSRRARMERAKELLRGGLLRVDPHGRALRTITRIVRRVPRA